MKSQGRADPDQATSVRCTETPMSLVIWFPGERRGLQGSSFTAHPQRQNCQFLEQCSNQTAKASRSRAGPENAKGQPELTAFRGEQKQGVESAWIGFHLVIRSTGCSMVNWQRVLLHELLLLQLNDTLAWQVQPAAGAHTTYILSFNEFYSSSRVQLNFVFHIECSQPVFQVIREVKSKLGNELVP